MQLFIKYSEQLKRFAELDNIHDSSVYTFDPENEALINLHEIAKQAAQQAIIEKKNLNGATPSTDKESVWCSPVMPKSDRLQLKAKIAENHREIQRCIVTNDAAITPRTQAHNRKSSYATVEAEREFRSDVVSAQISAWRKLLPPLLLKFSRIKDPRKANSVKHKLVTLMIFGLLAFVFRLSSRREMNRELTGAMINSNMRKIFPDLDSIPHADTLARLLQNINPKDIESAHVELIRSLINQKKFSKLLINGCLPISIDGTQKLYRDALLNDEKWCERAVGNPEENSTQQYIYVIEANITLPNGLNVPLLTEYLYRDNNHLANPVGKQDCETTAFDRMAKRLKQYFPRLKIILFMDAMYATHTVMETIQKNDWQHMITLPKRKLTDFAKQLNKRRDAKITIPNQSHYRGRKQKFYWKNNIARDDGTSISIHLVSCLESYNEVNKETGEIEKHYSEHAWISSLPLNINNAHELCNLGARKKELIEDSINTEKNRGYHYKHAYSYNWNAMQGFHYLMRLAHAINALSEFSKKLKKYVKELGSSATLKAIKETLFNPWLPAEWYDKQNSYLPHFQIE